MIGQTVVLGVDVAFASATRTGGSHRTNEDAVLLDPPAFLVADGVSGSGHGEAASRAATQYLGAVAGGGRALSVEQVRAATVGADLAVRSLSASPGGPACTLSGVVLVSHDGMPTWAVLNVGDSRVYRYEQGNLERWTADHVPLPAARSRWPGRVPPHAITRALGAHEATADISLQQVTTGERLLLCTDGVHGVLPDETLRAAVTMGGSPNSVAQTLIGLAVRAGSRDDVTAAVIDVRAGGVVPGQQYATTASNDAYVDDTIEVSR